MRNLLKIAILILCSISYTTLVSQNHPFPQNYEYLYGQIIKNPSSTATLQGLFNNWKTSYYTENTINTTKFARIKYTSASENGANSRSIDIANGMLIFVYMDNANNSTHNNFDNLWSFYKANSDANGLMNNKVEGFTLQPTTNGAHGNTEADIITATSLILAFYQWNDSLYLHDANELLNFIWDFEIDKNNKLLKPGNANDAYYNPSQSILGFLKLISSHNFHDWETVMYACNTLLLTVQNANTGLIPEWCNQYGSLIAEIEQNKFHSYFLDEAVTEPWKQAISYAWYGNMNSLTFNQKIASWCKVNFNGNPSNAVNGYYLDGTVFSNPGTNPILDGFGKIHVPFYTTGISISAMTTESNSDSLYLSKTWTEGSKIDVYGYSNSHTYQLLELLTLSGNTPDFSNIQAYFSNAITDLNNLEIKVSCSKELDSASVKNSLADWKVTSYENNSAVPITNEIANINLNPQNKKEVIITLNSEIQNFKVSLTYSGSTIKSNDSSVARTYFQEYIKVNASCCEPYVINRYVSVTGEKIILQWNTELDETTVSISDFTANKNLDLLQITSATLNAEDKSLLEINIEPRITDKTDILTVSYIGNSIHSTLNNFTASSFTNAPIQMAYCGCQVLDSLLSATVEEEYIQGEYKTPIILHFSADMILPETNSINVLVNNNEYEIISTAVDSSTIKLYPKNTIESNNDEVIIEYATINNLLKTTNYQNIADFGPITIQNNTKAPAPVITNVNFNNCTNPSLATITFNDNISSVNIANKEFEISQTTNSLRFIIDSVSTLENTICYTSLSTSSEWLTNLNSSITITTSDSITGILTRPISSPLIVDSITCTIENPTEIIAYNDFEVYPTITNSVINVSGLPHRKTIVIQIISQDGKLIFNQNSTNDSEIQIDISNFPKGNYNLIINTSNNSYTFKILKI